MNESEFVGKWSALHGNAEANGIVKAWLRISFRSATAISRLRISPNALTGLGVMCAGATALVSPSLWSGLFLALSLALDGVDGSLALVTGKASKLGAVFDAVADRISEALWAIAFYRLGVPLSLVLVLWLLAAIQEYARARIGSAGVREVGVITPAERPVRASFLFVAIVASNFNLAQVIINGLAQSMLLLQGASLVLVIRFAYKALK